MHHPHYPQYLLHGIAPSSDQAFYPCLNLSRTGRLYSPDYLASKDPGMSLIHESLCNLPLELLKDAPFPSGAMNPAAQCLLIAACNRRGISLSYGSGRALSSEFLALCDQRAEIELEFELERRRVAPQAVSRLSCLWLAEDSDSGRLLIQNMFPAIPVNILKFRVEDGSRIFKADVRHFDNYLARPHRGHASSYWEGVPATGDPQWEYLIDGGIEAVDSKEVALLCRQHLQSGAPPWTADNQPPKELLMAAESA